MSDNKQVVKIDGMSTREMANDVVSITFQAVENGKDANVVQTKLREAVHNALEFVRPHLVNDKVEVKADSFQVQPHYTSSGRMNGYSGTASITLKGTDTAKIAELATDIKTMVVASSSNSMSRKLKQSVESELMKEAIADFSAKADAVTEAFGFDSWSLGDVRVSVNTDRGYSNMGKVMALSASAESSSMQIESGKSTMNGSVHGTIILSNKV